VNKSYRCVWSEALGAWVAVSELISARGKRAKSSVQKGARHVTVVFGVGSRLCGARMNCRNGFKDQAFSTRGWKRRLLVPLVSPIGVLILASGVSAQVVIPSGTDIGTYLSTGTNWSATNYQFSINANATWNTVTYINSAAHSLLQFDGTGNSITRGANAVFYYDSSSINQNSVTVSNATFGQTAGSGYGIFYNAGGAITSNVLLNNVAFNGLTGAFGNGFYMNGTTGSTVMNVTAGTGINGATFSNNVSTGDGGGAISIYGGNLIFNGDYTFNSNHTDNYGGAIAMYQNTGVLTFNGTTAFNNNYAINYYGGAIDIWGGASTLTFNGVSSFTGNHVVTASNPRGGAINVGDTSPGTGASVVQFNNKVTFNGNYIVSTGANGSAYGGAISAYGSGNAYNYQYIFNNAAVFENNYVVKAGTGTGTGNGGAIYYDASGALVSLTSGTQFLNNYASTNGGAIYLQSGTISLNALTDNILFQGNRQGVSFGTSGAYAPIPGTGTPNAVYLGSSGNLNLNSNAGYQIQFYDPISSVAGSTVTVTKSGNGDVIFYGDNGATTTYDSTIQANTTVNGGNFTLANGVNYGNTASGTFTVTTATGTAGTVQGGNNSSLRAQTLTVQNGGTVGVTGGTFTLDATTINVQNGGLLAGNGTLAATHNINLAGTALGNINAGNTLNVTVNLGTLGTTVLTANNTANTTFSGVIGGAGSLTKTGTGALTLSGDNVYTGGTTVSAGTLQLGNGGTTGSIVGDVANNGVLDFDRSDASTFGGVISGTGAVTQSGSGTTILTADNTYTGGTAIAAGTLQLGNGGTTGSIVGNVANSGVLDFDRSDASTFGGVISGAGAVMQSGSGTTILTADNTYNSTNGSGVSLDPNSSTPSPLAELPVRLPVPLPEMFSEPLSPWSTPVPLVEFPTTFSVPFCVTFAEPFR
jgi:autotransporter-associated beta strand protein/predicted outer membrane repeat protein